MTTSHRRPRVVVVGGGFGGLEAVKKIASAEAESTLVDRHNYFLFQPLTYQVATGSLSPGEIAVPLRKILRRHRDVRVLMGQVAGFDLARREIHVDPAVAGTLAHTIPYDTLIVAGGSDYAYFGHDAWRSMALEVKSLDSALEVRGRILQAFEAAELEDDPDARHSWLTFVVVGAGPTGVEMAGQIAELARDTLPAEFREVDPRKGRVLVVETADRVLTSFPASLSKRAGKSLEQLGITLLLSHTLVDIAPDSVQLRDADGKVTRVPTRTVVWAAGVMASPLARMLGDASGAEVDRAGRLTVEADLTLPGHPEVFVLGDMIRVRDARTGEPQHLPGLAPVATQQGRYCGRLVRRRLTDPGSVQRRERPFRYRDKGTLATIGRARAVGDIGGLHLSGLPAWITWLVVHLFYLIGFENRALVLLQWSYSFFTRGRGNRLITTAARVPPSQGEVTRRPLEPTAQRTIAPTTGGHPADKQQSPS
jgi:NADH:ubiquinone reductase (H+-translocating)